MRNATHRAMAGFATMLSALGVAAQASAQSAAERADRMARALQALPRATDSADRFTIEREMGRLHVTGASVAVVADGKVAWARGYGVKEFAKPDRVDTTTLFLAGSISKPVFATGVLALVERGTLSLDTNVNALLKSWHIPESKFTERDKVTLRRILSHSTVGRRKPRRLGETCRSLLLLLERSLLPDRLLALQLLECLSLLL